MSGSLVSKRLQISRSAVWKQVQKLRQSGYTISAGQNRGYCLESEPDLLDPDSLAGNNIFYYQSVNSTNLTARRLAENGLPDLTVITAEEQLQGRGRLGRNWSSPKGKGLWFSIILRPTNISPASAAPVTMVTAATLAALLSDDGFKVEIKWPNDLLINGKKICGILTELKGEPDLIDYLIVGIGINVNQQESDFPSELNGKATSLSIESGSFIDRTDLLNSALLKLYDAYPIFFKEGFAPFLALWKKYNVTLGKKVIVKMPSATIEGSALDLNQNGSLILQDDSDKVHAISYGEII